MQLQGILQGLIAVCTPAALASRYCFGALSNRFVARALQACCGPWISLTTHWVGVTSLVV
jgi:hypothetical protein